VCEDTPEGLGGFEHLWELQQLKNFPTMRCSCGPSAPQLRAPGLTTCSVLNARMCLRVSEVPCSAASAAGKDGELKHQQSCCLRAPELEQKTSWP